MAELTPVTDKYGNQIGGTGLLTGQIGVIGTPNLDEVKATNAAVRAEIRAERQACNASGGYYANGVCHVGQDAVDKASTAAANSNAPKAIQDKGKNWLEENSDNIDEDGNWTGDEEEQAETEDADTATKDADQEAESEDVDVETKDADRDGETTLLDISKDFDGTVITEPPIKDFSDPEALAKDVAEQAAKDATEQARKDNRTEQQKKDDDDPNTETESKDKEAQEDEQKDKDDAAEAEEKDAQVAEEETKDKDEAAGEKSEKDTEAEIKDKEVGDPESEFKDPEETEQKDKDAEQTAKDVAEKALKDTTPDPNAEAEQKDKDLTESVNASIGNKDGEDSIGDTTKDGEEEAAATKDGEDQSDLNKTKDAEDEFGVIATKDTEVISDVIGSKDGENQSDTTKDGETANTKDISNPESELKDPESDKDGESGDLNDKDGETQEQIFQKDAEMSDFAAGNKDTETETKDPEGDGAKDGENDLLNLFKGAGVGAAASVPRTVTPFDMTQRDIRIQAPTMLSDIVRQQDAVAQLNQALARAMATPYGDKPSGRALNSLFDSLLNEKAV